MDAELSLVGVTISIIATGAEPSAELERHSSMTWITPHRGALAGSAALLSGCLLVTACGAGGVSAGSAAAPGEVVHGAPGLANEKAAAPANAAGSGSGALGQGRTGPIQQTANLAPVSQSIIYTAGLTLRSASAMATAKRAIAIVNSAGGYTSSEQAEAGPAGKSGGTVSLTVKVPVPLYQTVLVQLSSLGVQVNLQQQATDVTQQVADVNSLVSSQQAAISALRGLLRRAGTINSLLQVQQQISGDESQLESLQSQQRALDHETSYATISMTLLSTKHAVVVRKHATRHHNFVTALTAGWRALRHAIGSLLIALGAALPFLIVVVILTGIGYLARRRFGRRGTGPTAVS